jgi:hypothetical protein
LWGQPAKGVRIRIPRIFSSNVWIFRGRISGEFAKRDGHIAHRYMWFNRDSIRDDVVAMRLDTEVNIPPEQVSLMLLGQKVSK